MHNFKNSVHKTSKNMKKLAILASGEGTNAQRIIEFFSSHTQVKIVVVITNKPTAGVINRAERLGVPHEIVTKQGFLDGSALATLRTYQADFVILAGFLLKVPHDILNAYPNKVINIHPALLPKYGGKGMYGDHVHQAVIQAGEKESGITIHFVNEHYDEGEHIFQATCPVLPNDTPHSLAARVHELEYAHFPEVIAKVIGV